MAITYISGSIEKINGGTIVNIGKDIDNNKNFKSSTSSRDSIGSTVIDNSHIDAADPSGIFAHNNSRPTSKLYTKSLAGLSKSINGQVLVNSDAKIIRSSLSATAIRNGDYNVFTGQFTTAPTGTINYLCPDNSAGQCFQIEPPEVFIDIPYVANGAGELEQNGVWLRFRQVPDSTDALYEDWKTIYVPPSSLVTSSGVSEDDPTDNYTFETVDFDEVLPNGTYQTDYDTTVKHNDASKDFIGRIKSTRKINNSSLSSIFQLTLNCPIDLPELEFDANGDGVGDYTNPLLPMEVQMQQFEIIADNEAKLNGFFKGAINKAYTITTINNTSAPGNPGVGLVEIPATIEFTNPSTGIKYYENFTIAITLQTMYDLVDNIQVVIGSQIPRNGTQTALAFSLP